MIIEYAQYLLGLFVIEIYVNEIIIIIMGTSARHSRDYDTVFARLLRFVIAS